MAKEHFHFSSAIKAAIIATLIMTVVMALFGINTLLTLGKLTGQSGFMAYVFGSIIHFGVGIVYGLLYALIFAPFLKQLPGWLAGTLYSLVPFFIALFFAPTFFNIIESTFKTEEVVPKPQTNTRKMPRGYRGYQRDRMREVPKPIEKEAKKYPWLLSLIFHAIYGFFLGWIYRPKIKHF